jgi:hypothetical protein
MYLEYNTVVVLWWFFCSGRRKFLVLLTYLMYNTVVWLCQCFWLWREIDLKMRTHFYKKILLGYSFLLLRISFLYCIKLHPYSHDLLWKLKLGIIVVFLQSNSFRITIVSQKYQDLLQPYSRNHFSKMLITFYASRKLWIIIVFFQRTLKEKLHIFLINTLLLYIPLLALTDGQNYRQRILSDGH